MLPYETDEAKHEGDKVKCSRKQSNELRLTDKLVELSL